MIQKKLFEIQKKRVWVEKTWNNPHFKSAYMTLDSIVNAFNPFFNEFGILCYHTTVDNWIETILEDIEDGTQLKSKFLIINTDPQKRWSEITYGKRYNLGQLLNIITEFDDDGNTASSLVIEKAIYKKMHFEALAASFNEWWVVLARQYLKEQQEHFIVPEEKIKKMWEIYKSNQAITQDDIDFLWKWTGEEARKMAQWI